MKNSNLIEVENFMNQKLRHEERQKRQIKENMLLAIGLLFFQFSLIFSLYVSESFLSSLASLFIKVTDINQLLLFRY